MKELAQRFYEAYCAHTGNKSLATGQNLPAWADLPDVIKGAWRAVANAAYSMFDPEEPKAGA